MSNIDTLNASLREKVGTNSAKKIRIAKGKTHLLVTVESSG